MLKRVNSALFTAPVGAQIRIVVQPQGNNGVNDATFEYASQSVTKQTILGLKGCTINVKNGSHQFQAGVVFDPAAPGSARYDMFEVENGAKLSLGKFVRHSESSPKIAFALKATAAVTAGVSLTGAIAPAAVATSLASAADSLESAAASLESAAASLEAAPPSAMAMADRETAPKSVKQKATKKTVRRKAAKRKGATKTTVTRKTARKKTATKKTARKKTARKQAPRRSVRKTDADAKRKASPKRR